MFGVLYSAPTFYNEYDLNPRGTMTEKNSMSGTFGNGYIGEFVDYGDILYQKSDGKWWKYDGTAATMLVMSASAGKPNKWHKFLISGYATKYDWTWTVGSQLYINTSSAGDMTHTEGVTNAIVLGEATETNEMYFNPDYYEDEMILDYGDYFYLLHNGWTALNEEDNYRMLVNSSQDWELEYRNNLGWSDVIRFDESTNRFYFNFGLSIPSGTPYWTPNSIIQSLGDLTIDCTAGIGSKILIFGGTASKVEFNSVIDTDNNWISGDGGAEGINIDDDGNVGVNTDSPDEMFEVEWGAAVDVEIGRGTTDADRTFITLRSNDGSKWYVVVADDGTLTAQGVKP